jgi:adenine-specific DNA methylase
MQVAESLVRPTELASRMRQRKILKSKFLNFLKEDRSFKEILEIRDYSFEKLIDGLKEQMDRVDALIKHIGQYNENLTEDEKIKITLKLVYVNLVNNNVELFDQHL